MSVLMMTQEEKRKIIIEAFRPYLNLEQSKQALMLWAEKYADKPAFTLQRFVRECCTLFSLEKERPVLMESLIRKLTDSPSRQSSEQNENASPSITSASGNEVVRESGNGDMATSVFELAVQHLCTIAGKQQGAGIRQYMINNLEGLSLERSSRSAMEMWLSGKIPVIDADISLENMQHMINFAYIALCEYCGPMKADTILDEAIKRTAQSPLAADFPPEKLL